MKYYGINERGDLIISEEVIIPKNISDLNEDAEEITELDPHMQFIIQTYYDHLTLQLKRPAEEVEHRIRTELNFWNSKEAALFFAALYDGDMF